MGCACSKAGAAATAGDAAYVAPGGGAADSVAALARETHFSEAEVLALRALYARLANELHRDGLIHRDEFMWALFKAHRDNLFAARLFDVFDIKRNSVIEFGEFVRSLSVFHPAAPLQEKARFAFRLYDIGGTGAIERHELRRFLVAVMADNPDVSLDAAALDAVVDDTFAEMDLARDGVINPEEWAALVARNPRVVDYMTLPALGRLVPR